MIRVHVADADFGRNVDIAILRGGTEQSGPEEILHVSSVNDRGESIYRWETLTEGTSFPQPTLTIGNYEAKELLEALTHHFQGSSDARELRKDLNHERQRVDTLTEAVIQVAKNVSAPFRNDR